LGEIDAARVRSRDELVQRIVAEKVCGWFDDHPEALGAPVRPEHLATCEACRARVEALEAALRRGLAAPEIPVPPALARRIEEAAEARWAPPRRAAVWAFRLAAPAGALAAALLLIRTLRTSVPLDEGPAAQPVAGLQRPKETRASPGPDPFIARAPAGESPGSGAMVRALGPAGTVTVGEIAATGGRVDGVASVIAGLRAGFRRCYNDGLRGDPAMRGSVRLTAVIGPPGDVLSVRPTATGLSDAVVSCVAARLASARFAAPEGGSATVDVPVTFAVP